MNRFGKAAATSTALSCLFLVVYSSCNWFTSHRSHVGSFFFAWERHIPFVPVMILPYMSIDLFFVAAPFLARTDRELRTIALRIAMAILIAAACFLLFPLQFAFERTHVDGPLGLIFNNFRSLDLPFNECPSLHITLAVILLDIFFRHTKGMLRWSIVVWFVLIMLSPLVTYQHHMIDILGGFALAVFCFHLVRDEPLRQPFARNRRAAIYYVTGALMLIGLSLIWIPWSLVLLWPAFSMALVATGYLFLGPGIYRKENGRHVMTTRLLLGPVLVGQHLSLRHYARKCSPYDQLTDRLWIGRRLSDADARQARNKGVTAVVDLTSEFSEPRPFRDLAYLQLPILDLTAPTNEQIDDAITFIGRHAETGIVYVHCKAGYSRTAAVAGAYLMASGEAETVEHAIAKLRQSRPSLIVRPEAMASILAFAKFTPQRNVI